MFKAEIIKHVELDHVNDGCNPDTFQDLGVVYTVEEPTLEKLQARLDREFFMDCYEVVDLGDGDIRLEFYCQENDNGDLLSGQAREAFLAGESTAWAATYLVLLSEVTCKQINPSVLVKRAEKAV